MKKHFPTLTKATTYYLKSWWLPALISLVLVILLYCMFNFGTRYADLIQCEIDILMISMLGMIVSCIYNFCRKAWKEGIAGICFLLFIGAVASLLVTVFLLAGH